MSESRVFDGKSLTQADLKGMSAQALVTLHNKLAPKPVNRFSDRKTAERRVWALGTKEAASPSPEASQPKKPRATAEKKQPSSGGVRLKTFRLAPRDDKHEPREGTKRAETLRLLSRENGAKFSEIQEKIGWDEKTAYEGIRLINVQCGYGLYHTNLPDGDYRIFLAKDMKEFRALADKFKEPK